MVMDLKDKIAAINKKNEESIKKTAAERKATKKAQNVVISKDVTAPSVSVASLDNSQPVVVAEQCPETKEKAKRDWLSIVESGAAILAYLALSALAVKIILLSF